MREMKDSGIEWVGDIPQEWQIIPLFKVYAEGKNRNNFGEEKNVLSLSYGKIVRKDVTSNAGLLPESYSTYNIVDACDIIIRPTDLQNDKRSLRTGLVRERGIITSAYLDLKPIGNIESSYFHYLLHSYDECKVFYNMGNGVRQGINYSIFSKLLVLLPSMETQKRIANYLDAKCSLIDSIIAKQEQIIEKLKEYKLSVITEAITKGLNPDVEMKDSGDSEIGLIPKNSVVMKLKYLCNTQGRIGFKGYTTADLVDEGEGAITLGASHMNNGVIDLTNPVYISWEKYYESPEIMVNQGDILIVQRGSTIGKTAIVDKDYGKVTINPSLVLMNKIRINNKYLLYALSARYIVNQIELIGTNTAIPMISQKQINELKVVVPPKEEQDRIKEYLDSVCRDIDYKILKFETLILKLQAYKKSLIYEVVTGKKEV